MPKMLRSIVATSVLFSAATSLDLHVKSVKCESRPVTVSFDYICNGDYLCTFGEPESIEGVLNYYGLVDQYSATSNDALVINADFVYSNSGFKRSFNLLNKVEMPICHSSLKASADNVDGACPADGKFDFETVYDVPEVGSEYLAWAASGWSGVMLVEIYLNSTQDLVGRCRMGVNTMVSGSSESGAFRTIPSAKVITYAVLGSLLGALALCLCGCCAVQARRNRRVPLQDAKTVATTTHVDMADGEPTSDYHRVLKVPQDETYLL